MGWDGDRDGDGKGIRHCSETKVLNIVSDHYSRMGQRSTPRSGKVTLEDVQKQDTV